MIRKFYYLFFICFFLACKTQKIDKKIIKWIPEFQWPVYKKLYPNIPYFSSTFGEPRRDHFHNGLDIAGDAKAVYPLSAGKLLYSFERKDKPFENPRGPGNSIVLDHGYGWWSGYYHLEEIFLDNGNYHLEKAIGTMGNTGRSSGKHLHFYASSHYGRKLVNLLRYLPLSKDPNPPKINYLVIMEENDVIARLSHGKLQKIQLSKNFPIYLEIEDPGLEKNSRRGIYTLAWQLNKDKKQEIKFDELVYKDGTWLLANKKFDSVYKKWFYYLEDLKFQNGQNFLRIEATDFAKNTSKVNFEILVEDYEN